MEKIIDYPQPQLDMVNLPNNPDDDHLSTWVKEEWRHQVAYFHEEWKVYENGCWTSRNRREVQRKIRQQLRDCRAVGVKVQQARVTGITNMLEDDLYIPDRTILKRANERQKYINLKNGLFNLETFELEPHRQDLYFSTQLNFEYDPEALPDMFMKYLNSSLVKKNENGKWVPDGELVNFAIEGLAYSMTARTDLKASFWLFGEKDSGKSTMVTFIRNLMGDLHGTLDLNQLGENRFLLSGIIGKRVITFTEIDPNARIREATYKSLVGGSDEIYSDVKNRQGVAFRPEAKLWWAMNELPTVVDRSGATFTRLYIVPFNRTIPQHERLNDLEERLIAELPGIFNFLMSGYKRLVKRGHFAVPEQSMNLRKKITEDNDIEKLILSEICDLDERESVSSIALYKAYHQTAKDFGFMPKSIKAIAKDWERLGLQWRHSGGSRWQGVRLKKAYAFHEV